MFPSAHVIHCVRDPVDTCLSCYFTQFTSHHPYAYDLEQLGAYYRDYDRMMRHGVGALTKAPTGLRLTEGRYESLVADQGGEARRLLEFLGLPWDDACAAPPEPPPEAPGRRRHYAKHIKTLEHDLAGLAAGA